MWWYKIQDWFSSLSERKRCVNDFNNAAKNAFISGIAPVYMKAEISKGNSAYKHAMSNFFFSGFRIKTMSGRLLSASEVESVGLVILSNKELMRKLATLGFDTLAICNPHGVMIKDWRLTAIMQIES